VALSGMRSRWLTVKAVSSRNSPRQVAQRINLVTAGDREQVGAVCAICLMGGSSLTATSASAWARSGRLAPEN
jgi:hypothetical protein